MDLSIIIVNFHSTEYILNNIQVFDSLSENNVEVIIVSNSGKCPELETYSFLNIIEEKNNVGFGRACNTGARFANTKYLMFVNPDVVLTTDVVYALYDFAISNPDCGTMSPIIGTHRTSVSSTITLADRRSHNEIGACFLISSQLFQELGGFDESFFLWWEDTDLRDRIRNAGWTIGFANGISLHHSGGHSTKDRTGPKDQLLAIIGSVSGFYYKLKHQGLGLSLIFILGMILKNLSKVFISKITKRSSRDPMPLLKLRFGFYLLKNLSRLEQVLAFDGIGYPWAPNLEEAMKSKTRIAF